MPGSMTPRTFLGARRRLVSASAPGRLDVMGGIADYSGSLVLQLPIRQRARVLAASRTDGLWRAYSREAEKAGFLPVVAARTEDLKDPAFARRFLSTDRRASWAAYILGCIPFLLELGAPREGADLYLASDVPLGLGLSSSAAVEVATVQALSRLLRIPFEGTELPRLCQKVENLVAGAPCGLMDQLTSHLGRKGCLLPILCRPDRVGEPLPVPPGISFIGIDSGVRHRVCGASYSEVRAAAFMGYSLIALAEGASPRDLQRARDRKDASSLPFDGHLSRIDPPAFETLYAPLLPERMKGAEFLKKACSIDPVTRVEPETVYAVRPCSRHPVHEHFRVERFRDLLLTLPRLRSRLDRMNVLLQLGDLMVQSHASYGACGLGEPVTDSLVEAVRQAGPEAGVYGAKITGGGSGGTVCVLAEGKKGQETVRCIARKVLKRGRIFLAEGGSDGAKWT